MTQDVIVPQMGESITEGVLSAWIAENGSYVNEGDPIFELETDKVTTEVPAPYSGIITQEVAEGSDVDIGAVVANIDTEAVPDSTRPDEAPEKKSVRSVERVMSDDGDADLRDEQAPEANDESYPVKAGPAARKLIAEHDVDPASITGTGKHGTITKADVQETLNAASSQAETPAKAPAPAATPDRSEAGVSDAGVTRKRMSSLRQRIATRLVQAQHTAAILSTFNEIDMHHCMTLRTQVKDDFEEKHGVRLGFMSFFIKACVEALKSHPLINAQIDGTDIVSYDHVNMSVAVGTDKGLVVPVLRNVDQMSFAEIEREIRGVAKKAREGKLTIEDMSDGTFTISNGGVYGSLLSTPIINPPQSGILGMHAINERPVAINGEVVIRPMMYTALSYDHRIVDGAEAVGFLVRIKELIENPERMLFGL